MMTDTEKDKSMNWTAVCSIDDIPPNAGVCALVDGKQIAIFKVDNSVFALDNFDPFSGANVLSRDCRQPERRAGGGVTHLQAALRTGNRPLPGR